MMEIRPHELIGFLLRAKRAAYAAKSPEEVAPCRPCSRDLRYEEPEGGWLYLDSYFGSEQFIGEEVVWKHGVPVWAMNYSGHVIGEGFDGDFLKAALRAVPEDAPFRGPIEFQEGPFLYCNTLSGSPGWFFGREEIFKNGVSVYECVYHGGIVR